MSPYSLPISTLLINALLVDDKGRGTYTITVSHGRISSIIPSHEAITPQSPYYRVYDLQSRFFVGPSMVDHHVHMGWWARMAARVDLSSACSAMDAVQIMQTAQEQRRATADRNIPLVAWGLRVAKWPDIEKMTKETLDLALDPEVLTVLFLGDGHSCWCNTKAVDWVGVEPSSPSFAGVLLEKDCFRASEMLDGLGDDRLDEYILKAAQEAAKKGVTEIVDLDIAHNIPNWIARIQKGINQLRVNCGMYTQHLEDAIRLNLKSKDVIPGGQGLLRVGPYKIMSDGSLGTRTACCYHTYPSPPAADDDYGHMAYTAAELKRMFEYGRRHNFCLAVHAIGDRANTIVLETLASLEKPPLPGSSIEHAQLLRFQDIPIFNSLGLAASVQPQHLNDDRELSARFWPGRTDRAYAFKTLADAGVELRLGSDAPVAPLDPWLAIAAGVSRSRPDDDAKLYAGWHPEQKISVELAYEASTSGRRKRIGVGEVADICVLSADPLQASVKEIREMEVKLTMLEGRVTWDGLSR